MVSTKMRDSETGHPCSPVNLAKYNVCNGERSAVGPNNLSRFDRLKTVN